MTDDPAGFPMTNIGGLALSRMIVGTNMFYGASHFSKARDEWLRSHFTRERIYEVIAACAEEGINGLIAGPVPELKSVLDEVERHTGRHVNYIATPAGMNLAELKPGIDLAADLGLEFCWPHQTFTDNRLVVADNCILDAPEALAYIRQRGMIPGWSTHRPETIVVTDRVGYDCEGYIQIFNSIGFMCAVETDWAAQVIREAKQPVVVIKPLGAGRIMPPTGLGFVYSHIKPVDTVAVGLMSPQEAKEDIAIARQCLAAGGQGPQVELQYTRSKESLRS
jgi:hypothetical protein